MWNVLKKVNLLLINYKEIIVFGLIFGLYYLYVYMTHAGTTCFLKNVSGIPCPSCGMTRSYVHFFHGEFKEAMYDHPLFLTVPFIVMIAWLQRKYKENKKLSKILTSILILMVVVFVITYIIRMIMYFPDTDPLKFYDRGLIPSFFRLLNIHF